MRACPPALEGVAASRTCGGLGRLDPSCADPLVACGTWLRAGTSTCSLAGGGPLLDLRSELFRKRPLRVGHAAFDGRDEIEPELLSERKWKCHRPSSSSSSHGAPCSVAHRRLWRELAEVEVLPPGVQLSLQPEQLRATASIAFPAGMRAGDDARGADGVIVRLELHFPPQYPFFPPKVIQVWPERRLPHWQYEEASGAVQARCVEPERWSFTMGLEDVLRELAEPWLPLEDIEML